MQAKRSGVFDGGFEVAFGHQNLLRSWDNRNGGLKDCLFILHMGRGVVVEGKATGGLEKRRLLIHQFHDRCGG